MEYLYSPIRSVVSQPRRTITAALAVQAARVPGDFVETGVFTGGMSVVMARVARGENTTKTHWACDSFQGLPTPQAEDVHCTRHPDRRSCSKGTQGSYKSSLEQFTAYVAREKLTNVRTVVGWFHETLPPPGLGRIAFLRMDGDLYNSTMVVLKRLYPLVSPGGYVYIDDYGSFAGCSNAVDEYFKGKVKWNRVMESSGRYEAIWFRKDGPLTRTRAPRASRASAPTSESP
jgi:O-methyltransferase